MPSEFLLSPAFVVLVAHPGPGVTHCHTNMLGSTPGLARAPGSCLGRQVGPHSCRFTGLAVGEQSRPRQGAGERAGAASRPPGTLAGSSVPGGDSLVPSPSWPAPRWKSEATCAVVPLLLLPPWAVLSPHGGPGRCHSGWKPWQE